MHIFTPVRIELSYLVTRPDWIQAQLGPKAARVKVTKKLESHPCVITVEEMAAARHFIKTQGASFTEEQR